MKAEELVRQMTLDEKISLCEGRDFWHTHGVERLGVPPVMMCDGPHGLRKQKGEGDHLGIRESIETVCYPAACALASGFDTGLLARLGEALGRECQAEEVAMLLGPGLNIKRSPLCGRNFEYFSEDPYLAGRLAAAYVKSLQAQGTAACVKHFAANNQEYMRMIGSSNVDERTLHEIYLPAFEAAVRQGGARAVMCAYNALNGEPCATNRTLLTDILRERWSFDGIVVTDWGAGRDAEKGLRAGLDLNMPGGFDAAINALRAAAEEGRLPEEALDRTAARMTRFALECGENRQRDAGIDRAACARLAQQLCEECAVLLKNDGLLPLDRGRSVVFIGDFADVPRYQGSGSSRVNAGHVAGARAAAGPVAFARGYRAGDDATDPALLAEAVEAARAAETAVVFAGLPDRFETEGRDRDSLAMPDNQNELIRAVAAANPNTVVVLHGGAPMLTEWLDGVRAVLCVHLGGQEVGRATVRLLYGEVNPSGKLAESWPLRLEDTPAFLNFGGVEGDVTYHEGIYVGYRYYDKKKLAVRFPFGHGLSYTTFEYSGLALDRRTLTAGGELTVRCRVRNTGSMRGAEVVQLYVGCPGSAVGRPVRELKGFAKVMLEPEEERELSFALDSRAFAYYETRIHDWYVENGSYTIEVGSSSRDIRLADTVAVEGAGELPVIYTPDSSVASLGGTARGRAVLEQIMADAPRPAGDLDALGEGGGAMFGMMEMPLRALVSFGVLRAEQLEELLITLNG